MKKFEVACIVMGGLMVVVESTNGLFNRRYGDVLHNIPNEVTPFNPLALFNGGYNAGGLGGIGVFDAATLEPNYRRKCPVCDSSVYSYCGEKLFHDSCCCHNPNNPYDKLPHECRFADCSFLHSNSCYEHKLITACCCIRHSNNNYNNNYNNVNNNGFFSFLFKK